MVIATAAELQSIRYPRMLGLFQLEALTTVAPEPSLALLTETAIDVLRHVPTNADRPALQFRDGCGARLDRGDAQRESHRPARTCQPRTAPVPDPASS